jgi:hypothetical protein
LGQRIKLVAGDQGPVAIERARGLKAVNDIVIPMSYELDLL